MATSARNSPKPTPRERFLAAWQSAGSVNEVAEQLGITIGSAHTMAYKLRQQGYALKTMPKGRPHGPTVANAEVYAEQRATTLATTLDALPESVRIALVAHTRELLLKDAETLGRLEAKRIEERRRTASRLRRNRK
jgi:transposase